VIIIRKASITLAIAMPSVARDRDGELRDRVGEVERENDQHDADQHRGRDVDQPFDVPLHVEPANQPVQEPGQEHDLERERQPRRRVEMRLVRAECDDRGRHAERQSLRGKQVDEREHPPLRQHREGQQQQDRCQQVDQLRVEWESRHR
jgi:hypothetical protein